MFYWWKLNSYDPLFRGKFILVFPDCPLGGAEAADDHLSQPLLHSGRIMSTVATLVEGNAVDGCNPTPTNRNTGCLVLFRDELGRHQCEGREDFSLQEEELIL